MAIIFRVRKTCKAHLEIKTMNENKPNSKLFSLILRRQEQQNFRNLEFSKKKSFHFHGGNLEFPLSLDEKS